MAAAMQGLATMCNRRRKTPPQWRSQDSWNKQHSLKKLQDLKAKSSPLVFYSPHVVPAEIPLVGALTSHITFRKPSFFCKGFIRLEVH